MGTSVMELVMGDDNASLLELVAGDWIDVIVWNTASCE
jgi:hypothetical protein